MCVERLTMIAFSGTQMENSNYRFLNIGVFVVDLHRHKMVVDD